MLLFARGHPGCSFISCSIGRELHLSVTIVSASNTVGQRQPHHRTILKPRSTQANYRDITGQNYLPPS